VPIVGEQRRLQSQVVSWGTRQRGTNAIFNGQDSESLCLALEIAAARYRSQIAPTCLPFTAVRVGCYTSDNPASTTPDNPPDQPRVVGT
jgi:hypothetical protein